MPGQAVTERRIRQIDPNAFPDPNMMFLCFDGWDGEIPLGRVLSAYPPYELPFAGLGDLLLTVDRLCDRLHISQSFMELRRPEASTERRRPENGEWNQHDAAVPMSYDQLWHRFGEARVFTLHIQFRRNATWQGHILMGTRSRRPTPFRSALELLNLLNSALKGDTAEKDLEEKVW